MHKKKAVGNKGFSLAEMLIVVAILVILAGVAFIGIVQYLRSMTLLEMDGIAKEIYVAAQNHLSLAESQDLPAQRVKTASEKRGAAEVQKAQGAMYVYTDPGSGKKSTSYYFVAPASVQPTDTDSILNLMLPTGAIDETVRLGGSYIVRYDYATATVLDVFYVSRTGRFSLSEGFPTNADLDDLLKRFQGEDKKDARKNNEYILGWYGGTAASGLARAELQAPTFTIYNDDTLRVSVTNPNDAGKAQLTLIVRATKSTTAGGELVEYAFDLGTGTGALDDFILDDVTSADKHFIQRCPNIKPGEDVEISLMVSPVDALGQPIVVGPKTTNSLFAAVDGSTAEISSFRHLLNLENDVSAFDKTAAGVTGASVTGARQIDDLVWSDFFDPANGQPEGASVLRSNGTSLGLANGDYYPVNLDTFNYDGQNHSVTGVTVSFTNNVGLFGEVTSSKLSNLELIDFRVSSTNESHSAGALAGVTTNTKVTNVLARSTQAALSADAAKSASSPCPYVESTGNAGGLVGTATGTSFEKCAAAMPVKSSGGSAGGFVGKTTGETTISGCYSGGRTKDGAYSNSAYNVTGSANAGGLVGDAGNAKIENSYSTCSAKGATVGGLVGTASDRITNCYATGLVSGSTAGAFAGTFTGTASDCHYYMIVNELPNTTTGGFTYLSAAGGGDISGVTALDGTAGTYNTFVGAQNKWTDADASDSVLNVYYTGKFPLQNVARLGVELDGTDFVATHHGDWPAPELRAVNP